MSREAWHVLLSVAGAGFEVAGLLWVAVEASRARREEFGEAGVFRRLWNWLKYWLFEPPPEPVYLDLAAGSAGASGSLAALLIRKETELERLTRELAELRERVEVHEKQVAERFSGVENQLQGVASELGERIEKVETRQRQLRRTSLRGEVRGARLFILGAVLSAVANIV